MNTHPLTVRNWLIVALVAVVLGLWFVAPYLGVITLAALMAFLFYGTFQSLTQRMSKGPAATLTFLFSLLVVVVPVILVGTFTVFQFGKLAGDITASFGGDFSSLPGFAQGIIGNINTAATQLGSDTQLITTQGVLDFFKSTLPVVIGTITKLLTGFVGGIPTAIILALMYIFLFYEFLVYGKKLVRSIVALSPFQPEVTRMYLARVGLMANAMAKGQLVMSIIIGVLEALALSFFFDFWDYFFLMAVTFSIFNLIPLGAGIIVYPIIIVMIFTGHMWPGIAALILISIFSNLESVLRPKFIPKSITLTNGLTMLAAFGGIALYGLLGVIYGPILMIIIVTSIQMYLDYYDELPRWKRKISKTP